MTTTRPEPALDRSAAPLILTLQLDDLAQAELDALRQAHFPPERNVLAAHLTLFHKLPGHEVERVMRDLADVATQHAPLTMAALAPISLGRGVAILIDAPGLRDVRGELVHRWGPWLGQQDRQGHRPHVTIQNKVDPRQARALHRELSRSLVPFPVTGVGLQHWRYLGGPWVPVTSYPFTDSPTYNDPAFPNEPIL